LVVSHAMPSDACVKQTEFDDHMIQSSLQRGGAPASMTYFRTEERTGMVGNGIDNAIDAQARPAFVLRLVS
jgi:hypothetical protein